MYVYFVYPALSKSRKQLPNCLQASDTSVLQKGVDGVLYDITNQVPEKSYLEWSYKSKLLPNKCNLTAQIGPVQDKISYLTDVSIRKDPFLPTNSISIQLIFTATCNLHKVL